MALEAARIALLDQAAEFLKDTQLTTAAPAGITLTLIEATFPESQPGIYQTLVRFIWDEATQTYRSQIPT